MHLCTVNHHVRVVKDWRDDLRSKPGSQPRRVRSELIRESTPQPALRVTATGGRNRARRYRQMSDCVELLAYSVVCCGVSWSEHMEARRGRMVILTSEVDMVGLTFG